MASLQEVLSRIPGLAGYQAQVNANQQQGMNTLQMAQGAGSLMSLVQQQEARRQAMQEAEAMKGIMAQTGGDPAKAIPALIASGNPKFIEAAGRLKALIPAPERPMPIGAGGLRMPSGEIVPPVQKPTPERFSDLSRLLKEKSELPAGDPRHLIYDNAIRKVSETSKQISPTTIVHNPPPITPVTIQDPNDPSQTIVIDGRTKQVLGKGPKLTQTGTQEQKLSLGLPQAKLRVESMAQNLDRLDSAMTELANDPGLPNITGTLAGRTPNITNLATSAQAKLDSIKSQIFQSSLQAMREASKTGGAVGNVSDREGDKLERTIAALDQAQGTPQFRDQLKKAIAQVRLSKELIDNAFLEQYAGVQNFTGAPVTPLRRSTDKAGVPSMSEIDAELARRAAARGGK